MRGIMDSVFKPYFRTPGQPVMAFRYGHNTELHEVAETESQGGEVVCVTTRCKQTYPVIATSFLGRAIAIECPKCRGV
jgi:hypothetical protein